MDPKVVALIGVGLRIFIFICLLIALVVIATDKLALISGFKATFNDVHGYRYMLSVAIIGLAHTILQLSFSIYHLLTQNIPLWNGLPQFNYYADQVITWVLATAAGAGFAVSAELKSFVDSHSTVEKEFGEDYGFFSPQVDEQKSLIDDFFDKANIATAILFLAFLSMATLILLSPFNRIKPTPLPTQDLEAQKLEAQSPQAQSTEPPSG
ncbi:CASP-like protein 4D1 [Benincasa hispida]|uniref:CASP-like protein 4D1 n=1 Tax=Benincasa hispida TaxID=102211 RepID=UPI0019000918|nr:CASP-like protein 4D1 [Benincasa hispida]